MTRTPSPPIGPETGALLRQARTAAGMTVRDVADATRASPGYVNALEAGRGAPSVAMADALADAVAMPAEDRARWMAAAIPGVGRSHPARRHVTVAPRPKLDPTPELQRLAALLAVGARLPDTQAGRALLARLRDVVDRLERTALVRDVAAPTLGHGRVPLAGPSRNGR